MTESINFSPGSYRFTINDSAGDGMCCENGEGSYVVLVDGRKVASGGEFDWSESTSITI